MKMYTAQDMRDAAKCLFACEVDLKHDNRDISRMLRQSADMMDRERERLLQTMSHYEEVAVSKMETTTPTREKYSAVGNSAAMREALEAAIPIMRACLFDYYNTTGVNKVVGEMKAAISAPPRNCDVGTAEEQSDRFEAFCLRHKNCSSCPCKYTEKTSCSVNWA